MPFDTGQFLANLASPGLREALNQQKEQERERAKEFDAMVGYASGAGLMSKDAAKTMSAAELRQVVGQDQQKRAVGDQVLKRQEQEQLMMYREAQMQQQAQQQAAQRALAGAAQYMGQQQNRNTMEGQAFAGPGYRAPAPTGDTWRRAIAEKFPNAINTEFGRQIMVSDEPDALKLRKLNIEESRVKNYEKQVGNETRRLDAALSGKTGEMPGEETITEMDKIGYTLAPDLKGGYKWLPKRDANGNPLAQLFQAWGMAQPGGMASAGTNKTKAEGEPPAEWIEYLKKHPDKAASFDKKFGAGAAAKILGK